MAMRVYDGDDVDRYVAALHARIEELSRATNQPAMNELATEEAERVLGRALLHAQQLGEELLAEAQRQAAAIVEEAEAARREAARRAEAATRAAEESRRLAADDIRRMTEAAIAEARAKASAIITAARPEPAERERARSWVPATVDIADRNPTPPDEPFMPGWTAGNGHRAAAEPTEAVPPARSDDPAPASRDRAPERSAPFFYAPPPTGEPVLPWDAEDQAAARRRRRLFSR